MKAKLEKGQYCEFDIVQDMSGNVERYKIGYIKAIDGNEYIIDQVSEYIGGEVYDCQCEVVRNWVHDIPRLYMRVFDADGNDIYKGNCNNISWEAK